MYKGIKWGGSKLPILLLVLVIITLAGGYHLFKLTLESETLYSTNFRSIYALEGLSKMLEDSYTKSQALPEEQLNKLIKLQKENLDINGEAELTFELESLVNEYQTARTLKDDKFLRDVLLRINSQITVLVNMNRDEIEFKAVRYNRKLKLTIGYGMAIMTSILLVALIASLRKRDNLNLHQPVITVQTRDLSAFEDLYKSLMDKIEYPIAMFADDGEQIYANKKFNKLLNRVNKKVNNFETQKDIADSLEHVIAQPLNHKLIEAVNTKLNNHLEGHQIATEVIEGERNLKFLLMISEQNSPGKIESITRDIDEALSHINSSMLAIHASLELGSGIMNQKIYEFICNAREECNIAKEVLTRALGIKHGEETVNTGPCEVSSILEQVTRGLEPAISAKKLEVDLQLPHLPITTKVPEGQIKSLFSRMLINAINIAQSQEKISLKLGYKDGYAILCITNRFYISRELHEEIFKPDFNSDGIPCLNDLGLAHLRSLAITLDGYLWLESSKDEGSSFWLNIKV